MGTTVVFWSPVAGQAGTTTNLIAAASCLGMEYSARLLLLGHLRSEYAAVARAFYSLSEMDDKHTSDVGIDSLLRLLQNRKLEPAMLRDYALPLLQDRLDLLPGSMKPDDLFQDTSQTWLTPLLQIARYAYDLVLIDGGSGSTPNRLWNEADILVVCLPQNRLLLERFFQTFESERTHERRTLFIIGQYDPHSRLTVKNLMRQFRGLRTAYPVVHNSGWLDAVQYGDAINYWFRNQRIVRTHENYFFVQQVRQLAQVLTKSAEADRPFFGGKGDGMR